MPKTLVRSARNPVNMKLDRRTSFCTSLAMLSTVPGFGRPRAALRSEKDPYPSLIAAATALSVRKESDDDQSAILWICRLGGGNRPSSGSEGDHEGKGTGVGERPKQLRPAVKVRPVEKAVYGSRRRVVAGIWPARALVSTAGYGTGRAFGSKKCCLSDD
jgi:hypothetical protein